MEEKNVLLGTKLMEKIILIVATVIWIATMCYYNILYDIFVILFLLVDSYAIGQFFKISGNKFEIIIMQTAMGLGIIGMVIYFILLIGIGNKSIYTTLLILCALVAMSRIISNKKNVDETFFFVKECIKSHTFFWGIVLVVFTGYLIYAASPIDSYDTLTKHLPITIYATKNGEWYTNVTESIVYGEPMVLQYTYSTLFYSLGAYKALVLFNVVLFFILFMILGYFTQSIYKKSSFMILGIIILTTPFFFQFSTIFYLEVLPLFFIFSAFVGQGNLNGEKIWDNVEIIATLCGFSLFVKLTHVFTLGIMVLLMVLHCFCYAYRERKIKTFIWKMLRCVGLGILPSITSLIHIWYKTGNPLFPSYNGTFNSPYFENSNFTDPFINKLTFSWKTLMDIVFHTTSNIEMYPLGLGIFLLFIFTLPIASVLLLKRNKGTDYLIWTIVSLVAFGANTLTSYNLRYYFSVWVLMACVITIGISVCIKELKVKVLERVVICVIGGIILFPNIVYIKNHGTVFDKIVKDERIVKGEFCTIFDEIPKGCKVLSITNFNQFKGNYEGYFASATWHNSTLNRINIDEWEDYISSFDYILIDKLYENNKSLYPDLLNIIEPFLGEKCAENTACEIYRVIPKMNIVLLTRFDELQETSVLEPIFEIFENDKSSYYLKHTVLNETEEPITMRFQINWINEEGEFLDCYISTYDAMPGENTYQSEEIHVNSDAAYGLVYVVTASEQKVKIREYEVDGILNVIDKETEDYDNRQRIFLK